MAREYTIREFAQLVGNIADHKVDELCTSVVKVVGNTFLDKVIKETPTSNPIQIKGKSSTGLKQGWKDNKNFSVSKGTKVYTAVITNKAKSSYSNQNTGKNRTDYYAYYVDDASEDERGRIASGCIRGKSEYIQGKKFTDKAIDYTDRKINTVVGKELGKWLNEVF